MVLILAKRRQHIEIYRTWNLRIEKHALHVRLDWGFMIKTLLNGLKQKIMQRVTEREGERVSTPKTFTDSKVCLYCDTDHLVSGNSKGKADTLSFTHAVESEFLYYYK